MMKLEYTLQKSLRIFLGALLIMGNQDLSVFATGLVAGELRESSTHNFQFEFSDDGYLKELNWTRDNRASWERVVREELDGRFHPSGRRYYLHHWRAGNGWDITFDGEATFTELDSDITETKISESDDTVVVRAETTNLEITDTILFYGDVFEINSSVRNKQGRNLVAKIPFNLGSLQIGNFPNPDGGINKSNTGLQRLIPDRGGLIKGLDDVSSIRYKYGTIGIFSPVISLWDSNLTISRQVLTELYNPEIIELRDTPWNQHTPGSFTTITLEMEPFETRQVRVVYKISNSGDWQSGLEPYKEWFNQTYGNEPAYCPTSAFVFASGYNSCRYNRPHCTGNYDPSLPEFRFHPDTPIESIIFSGNGLKNMEDLGLKYIGVWGTTLRSSFLSDDGLEMEFNPTIDLIDPNIDAGPNPEKITEMTDKAHEKGANVFWFARPCADIVGSDITYNGDTSHTITKGTRKNPIDLRDPAVRDKAFSRMDHFVRRGVDGFYLDAMSCPGDYAFLEYTLSEFKRRYNKDIFIAKEGAIDRDSLLVTQIPLLKQDALPSSHSLLLNYLAPKGTFYGGFINNGLDQDEISEVLDLGYQPVISNSPVNFAYTNNDELMCRSWLNQHKNHRFGCPVTKAPQYCCDKGYLPAQFNYLCQDSCNDGVGNDRPTVVAGTDQISLLSEPVQLKGNVIDNDSLPEAPAPLTHMWNQISGPGQAIFSDPSILNPTVEFTSPGTYTLRLEASDGECGHSDELVVSTGRSLSDIPRTANVFNPRKQPLQINYELQSEQTADITIFDRQGNTIKTLPSSFQPRGLYSTEWDGKNQNGSLVASGVYLIHIVTKELVDSFKVVVLK